MAMKPCPEERCRQLRFFGSTGGRKYTKGHPKCERCGGKGVIIEAEPMRVSFEQYVAPRLSFRSPDDPLQFPIFLSLWPPKP